ERLALHRERAGARHAAGPLRCAQRPAGGSGEERAPLSGPDWGDLPGPPPAPAPLVVRLRDAARGGVGLQAVRLRPRGGPLRSSRRVRPPRHAAGRPAPAEHRGPRPGDLPMSAPSPTLELWFDLASNYSYLTLMRVEEVARRAGVTLRWEPFLLGPIFESFG